MLYVLQPTVGLDIELVVVSKDVSPVNMAEFGEQIQETFQSKFILNDKLTLGYCQLKSLKVTTD